MRLPPILIDPHLLALQSTYPTADELEGFIDGVLAWLDAIERDDLTIALSEFCVNTILSENAYPYDQTLKKLLRQHGIKHIDEETLCRAVQLAFDRTPYLEEFCGVTDVLCDEITVLPPVFLKRLGKPLADALASSLAILAYWKKYLNKAPLDFALATWGDSALEGEGSFGAAFWDVQLPYDTSASRPTFPVQINTEFDTCIGFDRYLKLVGYMRLWADGTTEQGARDAIEAKIEELIDAGAGNKKSKLDFEFGSHFLGSVQTWGFNDQPSLLSVLLETCARIVLKVPKHPLKPFRIDKRTTSSQRSRTDGALAFRTHLTKRGAGFRLMYWELPNGAIEFANVGDKDELTIE